MMYLCIIFASPLYFLVRKKWGGFVLNSILYGIACLGRPINNSKSQTTPLPGSLST